MDTNWTPTIDHDDPGSDGDGRDDGPGDGAGDGPGELAEPPAWDPQPWRQPDDLDGYVTPLQRFLDRAKGWLGAVVALALVVPAGAGLIDAWLFDRASDDVLEQLADDPVDLALVESVLLVTVASCDGSTGSGTAFVAEVDGQRLLLTNRHVVDDAATVGLRTLTGDGGPRVTATALSSSADLAVLEVDGLDALPSALRIGRGDPPTATPVRTVGFPLALPFTSTGTVAQTGRTVLLDLQIAPGASGSPVVDDTGTVVAQVYARTSDDVGVGTSAAALRRGLTDLTPRPLGC